MRKLSILVVLILLVGVMSLSQGEQVLAAPVCGATISVNTTLTADLGPCAVGVGVEIIALIITVEPKSGIEAQGTLPVVLGNSKETPAPVPYRSVHGFIDDPVAIVVVTNVARE